MEPQSWWVESITNGEILARGEELPEDKGGENGEEKT